MKQILLIRHGAPAIEGATPQVDPPLSALGHRQAALTGARLANEPIDRVIASPLKRAWQTAAPLAGALGCHINSEAGVAEVDQDGGEYVAVEAWRAEGGAKWQAFLDNPVASLGGDHDGFVAQVEAALDAILRGAGKRVAVFTHGLPINVALARAVGAGSLARFAPRHASITRMAGTSIDDLRLLSFNEATHFPAGGA